MVNLTFIWSFSLINWVDNVNWPPSIVSKLTLRALALRQSDWRNCGLCVCLPYLLDLNATLESSWFSRNVAWCLQVKLALEREVSLLIWEIHSAFFNFLVSYLCLLKRCTHKKKETRRLKMSMQIRVVKFWINFAWMYIYIYIHVFFFSFKVQVVIWETLRACYFRCTIVPLTRLVFFFFFF